ncbi:MAG: DNA polymerase III subunit gamma/tau [Oxalobacter sp.]|nr:DNA polymerase III subunit gamma/tau [Oxalobacter sp.]
MTYLVLARKYRPKRFQDLVGQDHVVRALTNALETGRIHHAYLFTGTRGVGKTTLSRILAKCLNCEKGVTATPCGECEACQAIDADRFVDYIELDAASNRGVNDMQQLLEQAVYAPTAARYKVYMVDEVHMLSNQAFNAMLKTLEEPPDYVKFILATTDPQKIPVTVLSRCLQFNLKQMPEEAIVSHLSHILDAESVSYERPALRVLAHGAQGSMRDALSLTDQAIAYAAGNVTVASVQDMLGTLDQTYLMRLLDSLADKDGAGILSIADEMASRGLSYQVALQDLSSLFSRIAIVQCVPSYLEDDEAQAEVLRELARRFTPEEVQLYYGITVRGLAEMTMAPDEYAGFTMTLLRMLAFAPRMGEGSVVMPAAKQAVERPVQVPRSIPPKPITPKVTPSAPLKQKAPIVVPGVKSVEKKLPKMPLDSGSTKDERPLQNESEHASLLALVQFEPLDEPSPVDLRRESPVEQVMASVPVVEEPKRQVAWDGDWPALAKQVSVRGLALQLARQSELIRQTMEDGVMTFHLRIPAGVLGTVSVVTKLTDWLSGHLGCPVKIRTEVGQPENTATKEDHEAAKARLEQVKKEMDSDPYLQELIQDMGAAVVEGSIQPNPN